nr:hypothetical protein [uncultured Roseovarius sp.]
MTLPWLTIFGAVLTVIAAMTSAGMILAPRHWQRLEHHAYGGARRPWQVWALAGLLLAFWALGLADFAQRPAQGRNWAGWTFAAVIPALWAIKAVALVFNPAGRAAVTGLSDPRQWRRVGLARMPIALALAILTWLA